MATSVPREDTDYLQVALARPVPKNGESRIRIDKTYRDAKSYYEEEGLIVFSRSLGIKRNSSNRYRVRGGWGIFN